MIARRTPLEKNGMRNINYTQSGNHVGEAEIIHVGKRGQVMQEKTYIYAAYFFQNTHENCTAPNFNPFIFTITVFEVSR